VTWTYRQSTGEIEHDGEVVGRGYSGFGAGLNSPAHEAVWRLGPTPAGDWIIGPTQDSPTLGERAMPLTPLGHDARGRTGFFIHADNAGADFTASKGCIVLDRPTRDAIIESGDRILRVVA
jgi:hypothetical protein